MDTTGAHHQHPTPGRWGRSLNASASGTPRAGCRVVLGHDVGPRVGTERVEVDRQVDLGLEVEGIARNCRISCVVTIEAAVSPIDVDVVPTIFKSFPLLLI
jgi:hypothetical protein